MPAPPCPSAKQKNAHIGVGRGDPKALRARHDGGSMRRLGNIWGDVCSMDNLRLAHKMARKDKSHYREVKMVDENPDMYLQAIRYMLLNRSYEVSPYKVEVINDRGKERELWKLPYFPDRIIQWALMIHLEPMFRAHFVPWTCASLPGKGIHYAAKLTRRYLGDVEDTRYCLKMDVRKYYPSIDQEIAKRQLAAKIKDPGALWLLDTVIESTPSGMPIGSFISQYVGNFYLSPLDHVMRERWGVKRCIRYMDDIVVFGDSKKRLHELRKRTEDYLDGNLNLELKCNYQVFPVDDRGVDFVGYRFFHDYTLLRDSTKRRMVSKMRKLDPSSPSALSTVASYAGWLVWCDGKRLYDKWIVPAFTEVLTCHMMEMARKRG